MPHLASKAKMQDMGRSDSSSGKYVLGSRNVRRRVGSEPTGEGVAEGLLGVESGVVEGGRIGVVGEGEIAGFFGSGAGTSGGDGVLECGAGETEDPRD